MKKYMLKGKAVISYTNSNTVGRFFFIFETKTKNRGTEYIIHLSKLTVSNRLKL
jgi:hypothetical protein